MKVTTRDLFNYVNPAQTFKSFVKLNMITTEEMLDEYYLSDEYGFDVTRAEVLEAKQQGELEGEQVQHTRFQDEVDCG